MNKTTMNRAIEMLNMVLKLNEADKAEYYSPENEDARDIMCEMNIARLETELAREV